MLFGATLKAPGKIDNFIEDDHHFGLDQEIGDPTLKEFLKSIHTPGHTPGSVCFYTESFKTPLLFSGDTLFQRSIGRTDLPGGDSNLILKSIKNRLYNLPDETVVITGHGNNTNIYEEKKQNMFIKG